MAPVPREKVQLSKAATGQLGFPVECKDGDANTGKPRKGISRLISCEYSVEAHDETSELCLPSQLRVRLPPLESPDPHLKTPPPLESSGFKDKLYLDSPSEYIVVRKKLQGLKEATCEGKIGCKWEKKISEPVEHDDGISTVCKAKISDELLEDAEFAEKAASSSVDKPSTEIFSLAKTSMDHCSAKENTGEPLSYISAESNTEGGTPETASLSEERTETKRVNKLHQKPIKRQKVGMKKRNVVLVLDVGPSNHLPKQNKRIKRNAQKSKHVLETSALVISQMTDEDLPPPKQKQTKTRKISISRWPRHCLKQKKNIRRQTSVSGPPSLSSCLDTGSCSCNSYNSTGSADGNSQEGSSNSGSNGGGDSGGFEGGGGGAGGGGRDDDSDGKRPLSSGDVDMEKEDEEDEESEDTESSGDCVMQSKKTQGSDVDMSSEADDSNPGNRASVHNVQHQANKPANRASVRNVQQQANNPANRTASPDGNSCCQNMQRPSLNQFARLLIVTLQHSSGCRTDNCTLPYCRQMVENLMQTLRHSFFCRDETCNRPYCKEMKVEALHYSSSCNPTSCYRGKTFECYLQYHANTCQMPVCQVAKCNELRIHGGIIRKAGTSHAENPPGPSNAPTNVGQAQAQPQPQQPQLSPAFTLRHQTRQPGLVLFSNHVGIPRGTLFQEEIDYHKDPERLSHGRNGDVYKVTTRSLGNGRETIVLKETRYGIGDGVELAVYNAMGEHVNIVKHYCVTLKDERGAANIFMELCDMSLRDYLNHLRRSSIRMSMNEVMFYWTQVLSAVNHLHTQGIIHKDIKAMNVLLCQHPGHGELFRAKLADFDAARKLEDEFTNAGLRMMGTPGFISPEVARELPHGRPADVFSLAALALELTGECPSSDYDELRQQGPGKVNVQCVVPEIIHTPPTEGIGNSGGVANLAPLDMQFRELIESCLQMDPARRPTTSELLNMQFVRQFHRVPEEV